MVDGKSDDNTLKNIYRYKKNISKILSKKDNGIYYAMNKGAKISNGDVLVFVNSGDLLRSRALNIVYDKFQNSKNIDFVFGTVKRHYTNSTILKYGYNKNRLFYNFDFATAHSTGFFLKRKIFNKVGNFNTKFKCSADYDLYYKILIKHKYIGSFTGRKQIVGEVSSGGYSSKISFFEHLKEETLIRIHNHQNLITVSFIFLNSLIKNMFK